MTEAERALLLYIAKALASTAYPLGAVARDLERLIASAVASRDVTSSSEKP